MEVSFNDCNVSPSVYDVNVNCYDIYGILTLVPTTWASPEIGENTKYQEIPKSSSL